VPETSSIDRAMVPEAADDPVPVWPSERSTRLAKLAAGELKGSTHHEGAAEPPVQLSDQAMADVLAAVDASTAANTKVAYRSDWARFTAWTAERGYSPLPAPPLVVAHYVTEAAAEQTGVGKWRYAPATLTRWVSSINQFHTAAGLEAPGRAEVVRRALSGVRRIRATPQVRRSPLLLDDVRTLMVHLTALTEDWPAGVAGPPGHGHPVDGLRRRQPTLGARRPDSRGCNTAPDGRVARADPFIENRPGSPRAGQGVALRSGPGDLPAVRVRPVAAAPAGLGYRGTGGTAAGGDDCAPPAR